MKTRVKRFIAAVSAICMMIPAGAAFAAKSETDVNIAVGKSIVSSTYGTSGFLSNVVGNAIDGNDQTTFIPAIVDGATDMVTIDLGQSYPITEVSFLCWGGRDEASGYSLGNSQFTVTGSDSWTRNQSDALTDGEEIPVVLNADYSDFVNEGNGAYKMTFASTATKVPMYRYIQLSYTELGVQNDLRLLELQVYTTAEAAETDPVVISVGKPIYTAFKRDSSFIPSEYQYINDGDANTLYHAYAADSDDKVDIIMNLQNKYPITKIVRTNGPNARGKLESVTVSNDPTFADEYFCEYDEATNSWYYNDIAENNFMYVKFDFTREQQNADDKSMSVYSLAELTVYSTKAAAKSRPELSNIALGKAVKSKAYGSHDEIATAKKLTDGDYDTTFMNYGDSTEYYQIDLGAEYSVYDIRLQMGYGIGWDSYYPEDVGAVQLSNDKNFAEGSYVTLSGMKYKTAYTDKYAQLSLGTLCGALEEKTYRYVRIYNCDRKGNAWLVREIEVYVPTEEATAVDVAAGRPVTIINNSGDVVTTTYAGAKENLVDGGLSNIAGAANGYMIVELDYPQEIEWVDVVTRYAYASDNNKKGFNVWLSNTAAIPTAQNAVRIGTTSDTLYKEGQRVRYSATDDNKYKYIIISGYNNGELIATELYAMSNDAVSGTEIENTVSDAELTEGATVKISSSFRSDVALDKDVKIIAARFDGKQMTDVAVSEVEALEGKSGEISFDYTLKTAGDANTEIVGFIWEVDAAGKMTMVPFGNAAR